MKTSRSYTTTTLALATLAALATAVSALAPGTLAPPGTDTAIAAAVAELPTKLQSSVKDLRAVLNMTTNVTHFQRFSGSDGAVVAQSLALIKYPTVDNDFFIDFIKLTADLDDNVDHVLLVCGHARPDACAKVEDAPICGPSDAADPEMANKTGSFCEVLNLTTTSESGAMLVWGAEKLEYLQVAYDEAVAAGETPQVPVLNLEVINAKRLMMILNISTAEELADLADEDYGMQNASDVEITLGGTADTDTVVIDPPETRRRSRMLLDSDDDDNNDSSNDDDGKSPFKVSDDDDSSDDDSDSNSDSNFDIAEVGGDFTRDIAGNKYDGDDDEDKRRRSRQLLQFGRRGFGRGGMRRRGGLGRAAIASGALGLAYAAGRGGRGMGRGQYTGGQYYGNNGGRGQAALFGAGVGFVAGAAVGR